MKKIFFAIPFFILGCGGTSSTTNSSSTDPKITQNTTQNSAQNSKTNNSEPNNSSNSTENNTSTPTDPLFKKLNTGFPASGLKFTTEDKNITWMDAIDIISDKEIETKLFLKKIYKYSPFGFYSLHKYLKNAKFLTYWFTKEWDESWFETEKIQTAMDNGYVPVFNYWYFGDSLNDIPSDEEIDKYYENAKKVANFLSKLKGKKIIVMEPEFNKNSILNSDEKSKKFAEIISNAIDIIKEKNPNILVSMCMMDTGNRGEDEHLQKCGYENCALGDRYEWERPDKVYKYLLSKLDFISFEEVVGQFGRDPNNPDKPISYTPEKMGIKYLADRIENLSDFLHNKYQKPVFLDYIGIASAVWNDKDNDGEIDEDEINKDGWNEYINLTYKNLRKKRENLLSKGLFGYSPMMLIDDPSHDKGGYQFFLQNEYHLGIIKTSAKDDIDKAPYGDLMPKGVNLLDYIYAPSKEVYEKNIKINEDRCKEEHKPYCEEISDIKLKHYYDMAIEKIQKEKDKKAILIPLYSYPDLDDENSTWQKVIDLKKKYLNKRIVAVVNPDNGDFDTQDENYLKGINALSNAGVEVMGYIYTDYANRDKNEIFEDIDNWNRFYKLYGIRGIFFDETSTDEESLDYYTDLIKYASSKGFYFNAINPGIPTNQIYIDSQISDVAVIYENNYSVFKASRPKITNSPSYVTLLGFLIYGMDENKTDELYKFTNDNNITYFYFTHDNDSNPYDSVSRYLEDELKLMDN
jgi:hypothetical protein